MDYKREMRAWFLGFYGGAALVACVWIFFIAIWELLPGQYKLMLAASPWGYAYFYVALAVSLAAGAWGVYKIYLCEKYGC